MASPRLLFAVNDGAFFLRHRGLLAERAQAAGYDVHVATPSGASDGDIRARGFSFHPIELDPTGHNVVEEARTIRRMADLFRAVRPDVVHLVTIKPSLYGGIAARLTRVPGVVFAISGLGYVFLARGARARLRRAAVMAAYRVAFGHPNARVIFQNDDDRQLFVRARAIHPSRTVIIPGSGVDLDEFRCLPEPSTEPIVILPARMLWDKGVGEFVRAAELLRARNVSARLVLVGPADDRNPAHVPAEQLERWKREGSVEWWGACSDMPGVYARAAVVCLPSYREGIPRVLLEASACGRAIVTTDVPGCRDAVRPGVNGLLVPARDAERLADALQSLVTDASRRTQMGLAGRRLAETEFSPGVVINRALDLYASLGAIPARSELAA